MEEDCLKKLVEALELNSNCSLAHCNLKIIDENSERVPTLDWYAFPAQQYFKEETKTFHIRKAPLCGLLYFTHQTIIHSFTQLLIKKDVFDIVGYFMEDQGAEADLEWGMRTLFSENIVHVPFEMATWRMHDEQLTQIRPDTQKQKHLMSLQIKAVEHAVIDDNFRESILKNSILLQTRSLKEFYSRCSLPEKLLSRLCLKYKLFLWRHPDIKKVLNNENNYFDFIFGMLMKQHRNTFVIGAKTHTE